MSRPKREPKREVEDMALASIEHLVGLHNRPITSEMYAVLQLTRKYERDGRIERESYLDVSKNDQRHRRMREMRVGGPLWWVSCSPDAYEKKWDNFTQAQFYELPLPKPERQELVFRGAMTEEERDAPLEDIDLSIGPIVGYAGRPMGIKDRVEPVESEKARKLREEERGKLKAAINRINRKHAPKRKLTPANPILRDNVPEQYWLECCLKSLGFRYLLRFYP